MFQQGFGITKIAGKVVAVRGKRLLIAECDAGQLPPLYISVADETNKPVGKIVDLYGSVAKPYVTVLCGENASDVLPGTILYAIPESKPEPKKKNFRRQNGNRKQSPFPKRNLKKYDRN